MLLDVIGAVIAQMDGNLPFVAFRKPGKQTVKVFLQENDALHHVNDFTETGFVFAPFDEQEPSLLLKGDRILSGIFGEVQNLHGDETGSFVQTDENRKAHIKLVNKGVQRIGDSELEKVVLSRRLRVPNTKTAIQLFRTLLHTYSGAYCYLWFHPEVGCWLGATPEILIRTENKRFTTMSLAGTLPFIAGTLPKWGDKEKKEQRLVTEYIKNVLKDKAKALRVSPAANFRAGALWHLRTKIEGQMQTDLKSFITALHPTPAVCGLPVSGAKTFILDNEYYPRSFYTGFLGELNIKERLSRPAVAKRRNTELKAYDGIRSRTELFVNLRCMQWHDDHMYIYVGGGITAASDAEKEWEETVHKSKTMLRVLLGK
ncbi:chorismate-binding protein [Maribacter sp. 2-571]|uniref:chorismate-binding protein n=1 Tax=Maribacter sp. 2-571 TaxID=3417569 RepID=UPI003D328373